MKNKKIVLPVIILFGIIGLFCLIKFFFTFNLQSVKTDKDVYAIGEKITYSWSDFRFYRCEGAGPGIEFYRRENNQWENIDLPRISGPYCLDDKFTISFIPLCCGECSFLKLVEKGNFTRELKELKIYEKKGKDEICKIFKDNMFEEQYKGELLPSYITKVAPPGVYKIKYGKAEKSFEIK
ncbi:MAG: hypothetical protein LiPW39_554 [Parcubacteria group bacterium LiPW_39]|nr:MAG: hypothetical protein LiPW39_554 [Parcubacteria group bacterium LiPW_39]